MEPGAPRPGPEVTPSLHNVASVLSAGPVTPGDGVGLSDAALILRACDASGRLLHPSRAATAIDAMLVGRAFPAAPGALRAGVISATYSALGGDAARGLPALVWDHVLAANLTAPFSLLPAHLAPTRADLGGRAPAPGAPAVAYAVDPTTLDAATLVVAPFDAAHPVALAPNALADFALVHTAPLLAGGWALLGELAKYVAVSPARFSGVAAGAGAASAAVRGAAGERVDVTWARAPPGGAGAFAVSVSRCVLGAAGVATAAVSDAGATCA